MSALIAACFIPFLHCGRPGAASQVQRSYAKEGVVHRFTETCPVRGLDVKCGLWNQSINGDSPSCAPLEQARLWGQSRRDKHLGPWRPWLNNVAFARGLPWQGQLSEGRLWAEERDPSMPLQWTSSPSEGSSWVWEWHLVIVFFLKLLRVTFQTTGKLLPVFVFVLFLRSLLSFL